MPNGSLEGILYTEVNGRWIEVFCWIRGGRFQVFDRQKTAVVSTIGKSEQLIQVDLHASDTTASSTVLGNSVIRKIQAVSTCLPSTPTFFEINSKNTKYVFATYDEQDRVNWLDAIKPYLIEPVRERQWNIFGIGGSVGINNERGPIELTKSSDLKTSNLSATSSLATFTKGPVDGDDLEDDDNEIYLCKDTICRVKIDTFIKLLKITASFPFVIVVSSLQLSNNYNFLRSVGVLRFMNFLIYILPILFVQLVLSQTKSLSVQRIAMACYLAIYLGPVAYAVIDKLRAATTSDVIKEGTFCFKPASSIRNNMSNWSMLSGFVLEWIQHCLYVIPLGIITKDRATTLEELTLPYKGNFRAYFWFSFASIIVCGATLILNSGLRGKLQYRVNNSGFLWFFYFNIGGPYFVSIVTIMFMGLSCDYTKAPPVLVQKEEIECWGDEHTKMAVASLLGLAIFLIQMTLLPSGTFKETMTDSATGSDLDIMFVPVYLQAHYFLKAIFCGVYVSFYKENLIRCSCLTIVNIFLLLLNQTLKPCSINSMNIMRDSFFLCAVLSGAQSLVYVGWSSTTFASTAVYLTTWLVNMMLVLIGMFLYYRNNRRSTEYIIATSFLNLEWQVSRGGSVEPRVLEPLISLTLSNRDQDLLIAKKYIGQLVWLLSYPNIRVQFQSAWALANLASYEEEARQKIHNAGGTKTLFEWYADMNVMVQLETLAALTNLTLSPSVSHDMVQKYNCIDFFLALVSSNQPKHVQFASIALGNLAGKEDVRELIRLGGGIQTLVACILSHEYQKRRYACLALANMALSPTSEIVQIFMSRGLLQRVMKIASRNEAETQREVIALLRNLSCHSSLRRALLDRGILIAIKNPRLTSEYPEVVRWCEEIVKFMEREVSNLSNSAQEDLDCLSRMDPLVSSITWSTWGSKLDTLFLPVFSSLPSIRGQQVKTCVNSPINIVLHHGITDLKALSKWKDSLMYMVVEKPTHGRVNLLSTSMNYLTYTPFVGYTGSDFFTYKLQLGSVSTSAVTVSISVVVEPNDIELGVKGDVSGVNQAFFVNFSSDDSFASPLVEEFKNDNKAEQIMKKNKLEINETSILTGKGKTSTFQKPKDPLSQSFSPGRQDTNNMRIEDLFAIQGTGLKDRFNNPMSNLSALSQRNPQPVVSLVPGRASQRISSIRSISPSARKNIA